MHSVIAIDTETARFRAGKWAPELACVTYAYRDTDGRIVCDIAHHSDARDVITWALRSFNNIVGHKFEYDTCVLAAHDQTLLRPIFDAYAALRITDTMYRQKLIDLAHGELKFTYDAQGKARKTTHALASLVHRHFGAVVPKDEYRMHYGELIPKPLREWPEGAIKYAKDDAEWTLRLYEKQQDHHAEPLDPLPDEWLLARKYFVLRLIECAGLRTNAAKVARFAADVDIELSELIEDLMRAGLVRADGTRDLKATVSRMIQACQTEGVAIPFSPTAQKLIRAGDEEGFNKLVARGQGVTIDKDVVDLVEDPILHRYAKFMGTSTLKSKDVPLLRAGVTMPIHTSYGFAETGRTTSREPNVQNPRRKPGVRECFVPRAGNVFMSADYPAIESRTWAQICHWLFGPTPLGDALRAGKDPHLVLAGDLGHASYDAIKAAYETEDPLAEKLRQFAKIGNYGFQGGMGPDTFIEYSAANGVKLAGLDEAKWIHASWKRTWPENAPYFAWVSGKLRASGDAIRHANGGRPKQVAAFVSAVSKRVRGRIGFTAAANTMFQSLAADIGQLALWNVAREQYTIEASPLFGTRSVVWVHDEIIAEVQDDQRRASLAACRLAEVMRLAANEYIPDIALPPGSVKPTLAECWSKKSKSKIDPVTGLVSIWREAA